MKLKFRISFLLLFLFMFVAAQCPTPDPPDPPIPPELPIEYVSVWICEDSQILSRIDCRKGILTEFIKGTEPTEFCAIDHTPAPPIPPIPDPSPPYIGGSYYQLLTESIPNIKAYIKKLHEHGGNATEIFLNFTWSNGWKHSLYKQVGTWSEPDRYGDYKFPMFDLDKWNIDTWAKLKVIMEECEANGIALFMRIQDYCSMKDPFEKRHYPYNKGSNIQEYTGGTWGKPIQKYYKEFNRKLIQTISESGLNHYFIVPMNEADVLGEDSDEWKDRACQDFHAWYVDNLSTLGVNEKQLIINIHRDNPRKYFEDLNYRIEWHWIASPQSLQARYNESGLNIFPNGDGANDGKGIKAGNYREPSKAQAIEIGKKLKGKFGYCYFLRSTEKGAIGDVTKANFIALDGLVEGLKK